MPGGGGKFAVIAASDGSTGPLAEDAALAEEEEDDEDEEEDADAVSAAVAAGSESDFESLDLDAGFLPIPGGAGTDDDIPPPPPVAGPPDFLPQSIRTCRSCSTSLL